MAKSLILSAVIFSQIVFADEPQENVASRVPARSAALAWQRFVRLHDGRTFVSDGRFAFDAALAKPAALPAQELQEPIAKLVEGYLAAQLPDEFEFTELTLHDHSYSAPSGVILNRLYVDYLRRTLPGAPLRFRMKSDSEPVVIVLEGKAVGLLMPMKQ